jgi:hypothetical protein
MVVSLLRAEGLGLGAESLEQRVEGLEPKV